jgi:hypothetical protein
MRTIAACGPWAAECSAVVQAWLRQSFINRVAL